MIAQGASSSDLEPSIAAGRAGDVRLFCSTRRSAAPAARVAEASVGKGPHRPAGLLHPRSSHAFGFVAFHLGRSQWMRDQDAPACGSPGRERRRTGRFDRSPRIPAEG
jgi:hypothetical protein